MAQSYQSIDSENAHLYAVGPNFGNAGSQVLDIYIDDPAVSSSISLKSSTPLAGQPLAVAVADKICCIGDLTGNLYVFDVSTDTAPSLLSTTPTGLADIAGVAIDGDFAFVTSDSGGVAIYDITTPGSPQQVAIDSTTTINGNPRVQGRDLLGISANPADGTAELVIYRVGGFFCQQINTNELWVADRINAARVSARDGDFQGQLVAGEITTQRGLMSHSSTRNPGTSDIPAGNWTLWTNTSLPETRIWANVNGVMFKSAVFT